LNKKFEEEKKELMDQLQRSVVTQMRQSQLSESQIEN